jgi:hypothetical protein
MMRTILAAAVAAALSMGAATAATVSYSATPTTAVANPIGVLISGTFNQNVSEPGLVPGVRRSPWSDTLLDGSVYSSITGVADYTFSGLNTVLRLVWGSPDSYNTLEFYNGASLVDSVLGGAISGNSLLVTISTSAFDRVRFISGSPAFEYANVSAVPLPAGGLLLLGALGGITALRRRKSV